MSTTARQSWKSPLDAPAIGPWQFAVFRLLFGGYLTWYFVALIPYGPELFGRGGVLPDAGASPLFRLLPSPFWISDAPLVTRGWLIVLAFAALALTLGWRRKPMAALLWFGWATLFCRNPLISNPSLPYIGLICVLTLLVPDAEALRWRGRQDRSWSFPKPVYRTAFWLLAIGYTFSGLVKLQSPSWVDGTAMHHLLTNPLARPGPLRDLMLALPDGFLHVLTWAALAAEIVYLPLSLIRFGQGKSRFDGRFAAWLILVAMHLGIVTTVNFTSLTLGMLLLHLFVFDPRWLDTPLDGRERTVFFDGDCGVCNASVRFFMSEDHASIVRYAPLQGETAAAKLPEELRRPENLGTFVYLREGPDDGGNGGESQLLIRSDGALAALADLGGVWRVVSWLRLVPRPLRDAVYRWVARNRMTLGAKAGCRLLSPDEARRILP